MEPESEEVGPESKDRDPWDQYQDHPQDLGELAGIYISR